MTAPRSTALRRAFAAGMCSAFLAGCALTFDARSLGVSATMAGPVAAPAAADSFRVTQTAVHLFWGLYETRAANLQAALAGQLGDGRGIANLRIRVHRRFSDLLGTVLTLGLIVPTSVTFEGVVVRAAP